jgi:uncharacterized membrane protein YhhN
MKSLIIATTLITLAILAARARSPTRRRWYMAALGLVALADLLWVRRW